MKTLKEEAVFNSAAINLWEILSDVTRCDWIDTVDNIEMEGDCRVFEMSGMGKIKERIIKLDNESMELQYSAVETMAPINHHLATINISEVTDNKCLLDLSLIHISEPTRPY